MDFIERMFGIAPDGGSGMFEFMLFLIPIAGIVILRTYFWSKDKAGKDRSDSKGEN